MLALLVVGVVTTAAPAPAAADDLIDLEDMLYDVGLRDPWVVPDEARVDGEEGVILTVLHATRSDSEAELDELTQEAARLLWERAEFRVQRIRVEVTTDSAWSSDQLPAAVVYERVDLETQFGPRPSGLDDSGLGELSFEEFPEEELPFLLGLGFLVALLLPFGLGGVTGGLVGFLVGRRRRDSWAGYGPPGYGPPGYAPPRHGPPPPSDQPGSTPWTTNKPD